jgi:hypothetical protein
MQNYKNRYKLMTIHLVTVTHPGCTSKEQAYVQ